LTSRGRVRGEWRHESKAAHVPLDAREIARVVGNQRAAVLSNRAGKQDIMVK